MPPIASGLLGIVAALALVEAAWADPVTVPLYSGPAPGSEQALQKEVSTPNREGRVLRNVTRPTLTVYAPAPGTANGVGILVLPGGGFHILSIDNEGDHVAEWLAARGVTAFVLKYRLNETSPSGVLAMAQLMKYLSTIKTAPDGFPVLTTGESQAAADAVRAMTLVRAHAKEWGVDPHKIGALGFSAGALLTLDLATSADAAVRPDFAAPIYGALRQGMAPGADAPPLFVAAAGDDPLLPGKSLPIYQAWTARHRPVELHIYDRGGHGFGMTRQGTTSDRWIDDFGAWLVEHGWMH